MQDGRKGGCDEGPQAHRALVASLDRMLAARLAPRLLAVALLTLPRLAYGDDAAQAGVVEGHLLAPCCYLQTLDTHQSELADTLRAEVRSRIAAGETPTRIEDDFAARYGERVRAVPRDHDRRHYVVVVFGLALALGALLLVFLLRRWRTPPAARSPDALPIASTDAVDAYDARLDEELRDFDA